MLKFFSHISPCRLICLLLTVIFMSSFPRGATALTLCLDGDNNHLVDQHFYFADCHYSVEAGLLLSNKHITAPAEKKTMTVWMFP